MSQARPVTHWQALARDPERAAAFYERCFGWSADAGNSLGYRAIRSGGLGGGIWPLPEGQPMVQLFVGVEEVDATLKTIEANGGRIIFPKQVLPDGDEMAVIADPEGITWGIMRRGER